MRSKPTLQKLFVNSTGTSPLFAGSMALKSVRAGVKVVKVDAETGALTLHEFASDWYVEARVFTGVRNEFSSVMTSLVADTIKQTVYLTDMGIHPAGDAWNARYFSVAVTKQNIVDLWLWLWMVRGLNESADTLEEMFPEYFPGESEKEEVKQQLQL